MVMAMEKNTPGIVEQGIDDSHGETGQCSEDDKQNHNSGDAPRNPTHVLLRYHRKGLTLVPV